MLRLSSGDGIVPDWGGILENWAILPYKNGVVAVVGRLLSLVVYIPTMSVAIYI